jgi:uncharacterized protein YbbK (DUF523 family)
LAALAEHFRLIPTCPECAGGLSVPRPAAEIVAAMALAYGKAKQRS